MCKSLSNSYLIIEGYRYKSGIAIFACMVTLNCAYSPFKTTYNSIFRTFSQHWIVVGGALRVLLLDFDGKFNLLIPNIEIGKAFR